jgi:CHAD domain-containing protein
MYSRLRKLHTTLEVCRPLLDSSVDTVNGEIAWFLAELRSLHNLDVARQRLTATVAGEPDNGGAHESVLTELMQQARRDALSQATQAWTSERYAALSDALGQLLGTQVTSTHAETDAGPALLGVLVTEVRRFRTRAEQVQLGSGTDRVDRLDDLRLAARRVRCAGWVLGEVDAVPASRLRRPVERLLKLLGERHDSTLAQQYLDRLRHDPFLDQAGAALVATLLAQEEAATSRADKKLPKAVSKAVSKAVAMDRLLPGQ